MGKDNKMNATEEAIVKSIVDACETLGWSVAIPSNEDPTDENIYGLIVGTPDYIDAIIGGSDEFMDADDDWDSEFETPISSNKNKKTTH